MLVNKNRVVQFVDVCLEGLKRIWWLNMWDNSIQKATEQGFSSIKTSDGIYFLSLSVLKFIQWFREYIWIHIYK